MTTKKSRSDRDQVFAHPIRTLSADELEKVGGGGPFEENSLHGKCNGGPDNQGRDFG